MTIGRMRDEAATVIEAAPDMIAKISRPMHDGVNCVTTTYNNTSSAFTKDKVERCDGGLERKARTRSMINWYGK